MPALGIIFSNIHDANIPQLTGNLTTAAIPFGGRYRLIDFVLSSMANSGLSHIGVITKKNYRTLMAHVGSGKPWDLARKSGGLFILPPFGDMSSDSVYKNRLEALISITEFLQGADEEYVILSDSDVIASIHFDDILKFHKDSGADITGLYKKMVPINDAPYIELFIDGNSRVSDLTVHPGGEPFKPGEANISLNVWVLKRALVLEIIKDSLENGFVSFSRNILMPNTKNLKIMAYAHEGYAARIDSLRNYYKANMDLLDFRVRDELFKTKNCPVYTNVHDSAPTKYLGSSRISNSLIADGCIIAGSVNNSIIFRGVTVKEGAMIKDSIIMQDCIIEKGVAVSGSVVGENSVISKSCIRYKTVSGSAEPLFIKSAPYF